ncbi:YdcF family protein (plasmid) [Streptomyces sp. BI20]|uniref:YdcF family protein n=1 Tax=Streptomyces sp. BI20 TaxID=3403460 RepID=UPI003C7702F2
MFAFVLAALFFCCFLLSVRKDRRRFRNAVLFGLTLITLSIALLLQAEHLPSVVAVPIYSLIFIVPVLGVLALGGFLIANGLTMVRKEGRRPANLLSGLLGVAIYAMIALTFVAGSYRVPPGYIAFVVAAILISVYVSFLFLCFLGYAWLYGRIAVRGDVDYVVMLGSGLLGGERVPPLLASRLRKGLEIHDAQVARGRPAPVLLTSGGQGPDEKLPEATAMARWLVENGAPAGDVREEDRSRTTDENLNFSREIMLADKPDYTCVVVTNNFHAFRAAMTARRAGVNGQVLGSPTARYFWPSATIREFVAVFWEHKVVNLSLCAALAGMGALSGLGIA